MNGLKIITAIGVMFLVFTSLKAQPNLEAAKAKASSENKKVMLYFSGSDWCAPCMKFKKTFIQDETFKSFAEAHLIIVNADFPRKRENKLSKELTEENEMLAEKYNPNGSFPLILLLDSSGKVLKKWEGSPDVSVGEFIKLLQ